MILYFNNPPLSLNVDEYIKLSVLVIVMWINVVFQNGQDFPDRLTGSHRKLPEPL
jgi:hypothetical protein